MANARLLVKRLKSVRNIRKITRTMELIATSRFKRAMDRATEAAEYTKKISEIVGDLGKADLKFSLEAFLIRCSKNDWKPKSQFCWC